MSLSIVVGAPFSGKGWWVAQEIERREADGELGLVSLNYTALYSALIPGIDSVYRDSRITDSGAARYAAYLLAIAVREANTRELSGYAAYDSPRQAVQAAQTSPGSPVVEVVVSEQEATRRARKHVELIRDLAPRAAQEDGAEAAERCRKMVSTYYEERDLLPPDTRRVTAPEAPSDRAIQYMWNAAIRAAKAGDEPKRDKWTAAAKRALAARGVTA